MPSKILFINDVFWRHYVGSLWSAIHQESVQVFGIHLAETHSWIGDFGKIDTNIHQYPHQILFKGSLQKVGFFQKIFSLIKAIHQQNFDILFIYGYNEPAYWFAMFYAKSKRKKVWIYTTTNVFDFKRVWYKEFFKKTLLSYCDKFICCGTNSKQYLENLGIEDSKITYCPYSVDEKIIQTNFQIPISKPSYLPENCLLFSGRFVEKKNLWALIKAFQACQTNWGLVLLGDGEQKQAIELYLRQAKIANIFLFDSVSWREAPRYYAWAKALVLPSLSEPWGLVVNEALYCGLPVLVSNRCGSTIDLVRDGENGYIFNPENEADIQAVLMKFMDNPLKKLPPEIMQTHTLQEVVHTIISLCESNKLNITRI